MIQARLRFRKETGALIEVFCLEPLLPADYALSLQSTTTCRWLCLIGNARKWKSGELALTFEHEHRPLTLRARKGQAHGDGYEIEFAWDDASVTFGELVAPSLAGVILKVILFTLIFLLLAIMFKFVGYLLQKATALSKLGKLNRVAGFLLGGLKGFVIAMVVFVVFRLKRRFD